MPSLSERWLLVGCSLLLSNGCASDPGAFGRCDPLTSVTVVTSPVVEFSWEPADCDASTLSVDYQGATQWYLFTESGNGLSSPIRYGVVPDGASASGAELLLQGRRYTLVIFRVEGEGDGVLTRHEFNYP